MKPSLTFYCDLLEFRIHERDSDEDDLGWVWLKWNDVDLMLNTAYETPARPNKPDVVGIAAHEDTILYFGCPDVDQAYQNASIERVRIEPPLVTSYGIKQLYLHDPPMGITCAFNGRSAPGKFAIRKFPTAGCL